VINLFLERNASVYTAASLRAVLAGIEAESESLFFSIA
jgi:hypothetical protein